MKLFMLYRRHWWLFYLPVLLCSFLAMWWAVNSWQVLPPMKVVVSGGSLQNSFVRLAQRYAEQLDQMGISTEIVSSDTETAAIA